jgi:acyl-CoA thioester hydrolase
MGHLNVGFYAAKAMEGLIGLAAELGMPDAFSPETELTLLIREQHIRFVKEARAGAALHMMGGVLAIGESDAHLLLLLRHHTGEVAAVFQLVVVHATAKEAYPLPWRKEIVGRAQDLSMEVPMNVRPRSIELKPVKCQASLERAVALRLKRVGLGAVRPADCDAFGRMRSELMIARISDGGPHFFDSGRPGLDEYGARTGVAALEYRLIYLAWPRAANRLELRWGLHSSNARIRKQIHWMLDPLTGEPWGVAENVTASFDLETRKLITLSDKTLAQINASAIPGLTL